MVVFCGTLLIIMALIPSEALAWGPAAHLAIGSHVLGALGALPGAIAAALASHPRSFLYGCLAADILVGKGCRPRPGHSHGWGVALALLEQASTPRLTAHAYGYLTHLAADVIAHNYYVPNALGPWVRRGKLAHSYAEMLADAHIRIPRHLGASIATLHFPEADRCLRLATGQRPLVFRIKKGLFQGGVRAMEGLPRTSCTHLTPLVHTSLNLSLRLVWHTLLDPRYSLATAHDPIGAHNLKAAQTFRRQRAFYRRHNGGVFFPLAPDLVPLEARHESLAGFFA